MGSFRSPRGTRSGIEPATVRDAPPSAEIPGLPAAFQCDLADDTLRWAPGVYHIFGIAPGTRVEREAIVALYTDESRALLDRLRAEAIATCGSFTFEAQIRRMDGALRWMRVTADVASENGRARMLYGTKQDITHEMGG